MSNPASTPESINMHTPEIPLLMNKPAHISGPMLDVAIVRVEEVLASPASAPYHGNAWLTFGTKVYDYYNLKYGACMYRLTRKAKRYYFSTSSDAFGRVDDRTDEKVQKVKDLDRLIDKLSRERQRIVQNQMQATM